jgi:hypothetical protein
MAPAACADAPSESEFQTGRKAPNLARPADVDHRHALPLSGFGPTIRKWSEFRLANGIMEGALVIEPASAEGRRYVSAAEP